MSDDSEFSRRRFVAGSLIVGGGLVFLAKQSNARGALAPHESGTSAAAPSAGTQLLLFNADHADACRAAAEHETRGCIARPVVGDSVRFAREVFAAREAPEIVSGLTHYADFIMLSGCAAEHGYRVISEQAHGSLIAWKVGRGRAICSE